MATPTSSDVVNGLDTNRLGGLAEALKGNPRAGHVTFATNSRWQDGARVHTGIAGFAVDGETAHADTRRFVLLSDEPTELAGSDAAAGPAEQLMHAVASCGAAAINANAAFMDVPLDRLEIALEGDVDLHGILALDPAVRPGFSELRASISIAGQADDATLREIASRGVAFSPMRDSVEQGVSLKSEITVRNQAGKSEGGH